MLKVLPERSKDVIGRFLFPPLHDQRGGCSGLRLEEHVEMVGHQYPTDQEEIQFLLHLFEPLDKGRAETFGEKEWRSAVGAGGDELQLTGCTYAAYGVRERHSSPRA
jgi:hypothetical protein